MELSALSKSLPAAVVDKRELRRLYKESPPPMGVYVVRNLANQRVLVGASANPEGAMNRLRFELAMKSHRNGKLMADWIEHGAGNFRFEVIDTVKKCDDPGFDAKAELASLLAMWCEEFDCHGEWGYNPGEAA
jgi:hypothetical protein